MPRPTILLFVLGLLTAAGSAPAQLPGEPWFETVGDAESISNGITTALAQDASGLLWVGTPDGLLRYDGYRFHHYRHQPERPGSISHNYTRALLPLADGRVWVATQGGGVSVYDPATDLFAHHLPNPDDPHSLGDDSALALAADQDGVIWIGFATHGLDRWDPRTQRFEHHRPNLADPQALRHGTVRALLVDRAGDLWIGTRDGLHRRRAGSDRLERVASDPLQPDSLDGQYVYTLYEAADGRVWIGTQAAGAAVLDPASLTLQWFPPGGEDGLSHPWVDGFVEAQPGQLWIATFGGGIDVLDLASGRIVQRIRHDPAVPGSVAMDRVLAPLRDRSGLIWVGTWGGGLQRHNPANAAAFRSLRHSASRPGALSHSSVLAVLELPDGRLWLGTGGNGIDVLDRARGVVGGYRADPRTPTALRDGTVRALARSSDGSLWVGTQQAGLHRYLPDQDGFRAIEHTLPDNRVRRLLATRNGRLLIGTQSGLAELDPATETVSVLTFADGKPLIDAVWSMSEDRDGHLWVGTPNDLLLRRAGEAVLHPLDVLPGAPGTLSHNAVMDLHTDAEGSLWAASPGGVDRLREWREGLPWFEPWGLDIVRPERSFGLQLLADRHGRLWTQRYVLDTGRGEAHAYGRADGVDVGNFELGTGASTADGLLLFGGTRGLLLIDPPRFQRWQYQPPLVATALEIDGQREPLGRLADGITLAPDHRRLSLQFSALDYSAPEQNRYAYRLEGLDPDWIPTDASQRVATYNNLWPGRYRLRVRGSNRNGDWSPYELDIALTVQPAWWQTPWFLALLFAALAALTFGGYRLRTARIRQRANELQALVRLRTSELTAAKERAETALSQLQGAQQQLVAAEKMASLGQLVAGIAHEVNTPIGVAVTAASHLQHATEAEEAKLDGGRLTRGDLNRWRATVHEATRLILGSLGRAHALINSFKQVAVDQSSEQRRRFELRAFLDEVQFALQPTYRRSASLEIDCPEGIELDTYPGALFQILTNLVNNAVLHAFAPEQHGRMDLQARRVGETVVLRFSDNGAGMPADAAARAFDPFFTTRRGSGGSGLGLHVVYNLTTQLLGGRIELHSSPGHGTSVVVTLPLQAPERPADDSAPPPAPL
jgi:ligand-binding sensor domain-containing protein/signal transduction histidine kinase